MTISPLIPPLSSTPTQPSLSRDPAPPVIPKEEKDTACWDNAAHVEILVDELLRATTEHKQNGFKPAVWYAITGKFNEKSGLNYC
jgi:hypothetical protein